MQDLFKRLPRAQQPPFTWLFIGPQGTRSPLHMDVWYTDTWVAQLDGKKSWKLFPPSELEKIRTGDDDKSATSSRGYVDLQNIDHERFPRVHEAVYWSHVIEPGQLLYVPSRWAHEVVSLEAGVSLSTNFLAEPHAKIVVSNMAASVVCNQLADGVELAPKERFIALMQQRLKLTKALGLTAGNTPQHSSKHSTDARTHSQRAE